LFTKREGEPDVGKTPRDPDQLQALGASCLAPQRPEIAVGRQRDRQDVGEEVVLEVVDLAVRIDAVDAQVVTDTKAAVRAHGYAGGAGIFALVKDLKVVDRAGEPTDDRIP